MIRVVAFDLDGTIGAYIDKEGPLDLSLIHI